MKRLLPLFLVVVIDLLGFGIIIPLFPFMGVRLDVSPAAITLILAVYSFCQFLAAPVWGRLSDRFGRRPILMSSMLGASLSYLMLAHGDSSEWLVASRVLGGLMAGNISAAFAYAADVTTEEDRAKGLGLIGAGIGLGFMLGPALGGLLAGGDNESADFVLPALTAAGLSLLAFTVVWLLLPESRSAVERRRQAGGRGDRLAWRLVLHRPVLGQLVLAALLITIAHAMLESIIALWALDRFGFGPRQVGWLLLLMGGVLVIMQGGVVGQLTRRFGEKCVAIGGLLCYLAGLALIAQAASLAVAVAGGVLCGLGAGAYTPTLSSMVSKQADPGERGVVMGTYQSAASLARIIGPSVSGAVYSGIAINAPFVLGVLVALPAIWLVWHARIPAAQAAA